MAPYKLFVFPAAYGLALVHASVLLLTGLETSCLFLVLVTAIEHSSFLLISVPVLPLGCKPHSFRTSLNSIVPDTPCVLELFLAYATCLLAQPVCSEPVELICAC